MTALSVLPTANLQYPKEMQDERAFLLSEYSKITEKTSIRVRLALIIRTLNLMEKQLFFENYLRVRAFAQHQINKAEEKNRLLNGR